MKANILRAAVVAAAVTVSLGANAADSNPPKSNAQPSMQHPSGMTDDTNAAATDAKALNSTDRGFITEAIQDDRQEIQMAKLAESSGSSEKVKAFGRKLVTDHQKNLTQLESMAQKFKIDVPTEQKKMMGGDMDKLTSATGAQFDTQFATAMVKDHQKAIDMYTKQVREGQNPQLIQFATRTLPILEQHLQQAKQLSSGKTSSRSQGVKRSNQAREPSKARTTPPASSKSKTHEQDVPSSDPSTP